MTMSSSLSSVTVLAGWLTGASTTDACIALVSSRAGADVGVGRAACSGKWSCWTAAALSSSAIDDSDHVSGRIFCSSCCSKWRSGGAVGAENAEVGVTGGMDGAATSTGGGGATEAISAGGNGYAELGVADGLVARAAWRAGMLKATGRTGGTAVSTLPLPVEIGRCRGERFG